MANRAYELLHRISTLLRAEERAVAADHGLKQAQLDALAYLSRCNRYSDTPSAVTEFLGVTKGTASQTLRRLEEKKLIAVAADAEDRRIVRLSVTSKGAAVLRDVLPPRTFLAALKSVHGGTGSLEQSLTELLRSVQRANDARSFGVCRTCDHFESSGKTARCGLTGESLRREEAERICREHVMG